MARLFDNNAANYMTRSGVNLGLNGLTACSFAFWLNVSSTPGAEMAILRKVGTSGWGTIWANLRWPTDTGKVGFAVENSTLTQAPMWVSPNAAPVGTWTRYLFAWQRNAGDATDGKMYVNGQEVTPTFITGGYTTSFVMDEVSDLLRFGGMPEWPMTLDAALAWVCIWNRQLTSGEAATDASDPTAVTSGRLSLVSLCPDLDRTLGGEMTVNGTLACEPGPFNVNPLQHPACAACW